MHILVQCTKVPYFLLEFFILSSKRQNTLCFAQPATELLPSWPPSAKLEQKQTFKLYLDFLTISLHSGVQKVREQSCEHYLERFCKIGMSFLNIYSHLQANSVKSVSYFFKRTSSSQVTIEIGKNPPKMERILAYSWSNFSIPIKFSLCSVQKQHKKDSNSLGK